MGNHEKYAEMIQKGNPDFIEVKSYMHVGPSRQRLQRENMPLHEEIVSFCQELVRHLPGYEIVSEHIPSRVVMFAQKKFKKEGVWHTWIDFEKWHTLVNSRKEFGTEEYLLKTPQTGLSGTGTLDRRKAEGKEKHLSKVRDNEEKYLQKNETSGLVDEQTEELAFYVEGEYSKRHK